MRTIILYIIAGIFFFTGIFMLLRQIFSKESPADKRDLLIKGQEQLIKGQEELKDEHIEIIKILQEE